MLQIVDDKQVDNALQEATKNRDVYQPDENNQSSEKNRIIRIITHNALNLIKEVENPHDEEDSFLLDRSTHSEINE